MVKSAASRNKSREAFIREYGAKFQYVPDLQISKVRKHLTNVRFDDGIDEINVARMAATLEAGQPMEPITVVKNGTGYDALDGHHRLMAHQQLGNTTCPAIVCEDLSDDDIKFLQRTLNRLNGRGEHHPVEQAAAMVADDLISVERAIKLFGCSKTAVQKRLRASAVRLELHDKNADSPSKRLSDAQLSSMHKILKRTEALVPTANLAMEANLSGPEVAKLSSDLADCPNDAAIHEMIGRKRKFYGERIKTSTRSTKRNLTLAEKISRHASSIRNLANTKNFEKAFTSRLSPSQKKAFRREFEQTRTVIDECIGLL